MATLPTAIRDVYTVSDEEAQEKASEIVARVGNKTLTNDQLQMFYWANILSFLRDYGSYLPSLGLDITQPLSEQYFDEATKTTWEQYFLDYTLHVWHRYTAVCLLGEEAGYVLDAETQEYMDNLADSLEEIAVEGGFESGLALLQTQAGPGITVDGYLKYMYTCQYSMGYFDLVYESMDPPMEDLEAFYEENIDAFAQNGITKESGNLVELHKTEDHSVLSIDVPYNEKPTGYQLDYLIQMIEQDKPANPTMEDVLTSFRVVCEADRKIREKLI